MVVIASQKGKKSKKSFSKAGNANNILKSLTQPFQTRPLKMRVVNRSKELIKEAKAIVKSKVEKKAKEVEKKFFTGLKKVSHSIKLKNRFGINPTSSLANSFINSPKTENKPKKMIKKQLTEKSFVFHLKEEVQKKKFLNGRMADMFSVS